MGLTHLKENIIEIAWQFEYLASKDSRIEYNGSETLEFICDLADQFEEEYKDVDWNGDNPPMYLEEICKFTKRNVYEHYGIEVNEDE